MRHDSDVRADIDMRASEEPKPLSPHREERLKTPKSRSRLVGQDLEINMGLGSPDIKLKSPDIKIESPQHDLAMQTEPVKSGAELTSSQAARVLSPPRALFRIEESPSVQGVLSLFKAMGTVDGPNVDGLPIMSVKSREKETPNNGDLFSPGDFLNNKRASNAVLQPIRRSRLYDGPVGGECQDIASPPINTRCLRSKRTGATPRDTRGSAAPNRLHCVNLEAIFDAAAAVEASMTKDQ